MLRLRVKYCRCHTVTKMFYTILLAHLLTAAMMNTTNCDSESTLILEIKEQRLEMARALLEVLEIAVQLTDNSGRHILMHAMLLGSLLIVSLFMKSTSL